MEEEAKGRRARAHTSDEVGASQRREQGGDHLWPARVVVGELKDGGEEAVGDAEWREGRTTLDTGGQGGLERGRLVLVPERRRRGCTGWKEGA